MAKRLNGRRCGELREETGIVVDDPGPILSERRVVLMLPDGEEVEAVEYYFVVHVADGAITTNGWTDHERSCMKDHRWWSFDDIAGTVDIIWPETLSAILQIAGAAREKLLLST